MPVSEREREEKTATSQPLGARDASSRVLVAAFSSQHIHLSSVSETCLRVCCGGQGSAQTSKAAEAGAAALVFGHELFAENEIDIEHRPAKRLASAGQDSTNRSEEHAEASRHTAAIERTYKHTTPSNECSALRDFASENTPLGLPPLTLFPASQSCPPCLRASEPPSSLPASSSREQSCSLSHLSAHLTRVPLNAVLIFRLCEIG